ncbi:hypothetical protein O1L55_33685 [Streptomyces albulus]|nr:hypothetical protein [Streptomyces noursei]
MMHRHRALCERAVDPLEIAAGLEAHGVTDRAAARFRHRDVFSLAEELYARIPRADEPVRRPAPGPTAEREPDPEPAPLLVAPRPVPGSPAAPSNCCPARSPSPPSPPTPPCGTRPGTSSRQSTPPGCC